MNGLTFCLSHSWGGLEQTAVYDVQQVVALGQRMRVVALEGSPVHEILRATPEVEVIALPYRPRDHFDFRLKKDLERWFSEGVNLIHIHQTTLLGSIVPWLWKYPKVALIASRHILSDHRKTSLYHEILYKRIDALVVMSQALRKNVIDTHAIHPSKVEVIHLGLDFDKFDPEKVDAERQRAEWGADRDTTVVGLVGRIDPAKGQSTFIQAAAGLKKRLQRDKKLKFVIVGEETLGTTQGYLDELIALVTQFRLENDVIFTGFRTNIPECMQAFDLFVMPSKQEAFGLVAIEAMAMECPIVISNGGSAYEIVGNEEFGLLVRPNDAFDLQRQLFNLLQNDEMIRKMGKAAREHVKKFYDRRDRMQKTLALYERGLKKRLNF